MIEASSSSPPPRVLLFNLLFNQGGITQQQQDEEGGVGIMDLSKVGEKILSSVRSARSLGILPLSSDRPEVPARAVAAAAVARAIASLPPHQRHSLPSGSDELVSIYGSRPRGEIVEEIEEEFYEEEFDPVKHVLDHIPSEEKDLTYFESKATLRLAQLDRISERLSRHVMEHYEEMVKGMHLVGELEQDLKVANVICKNGRRHITSSLNEVSRDLVVTSKAKKKQALLDLIPILTELRHATEMQMSLERHVEEGNYFKAFQVLSEYLQVLDSLSELSAVQEMSRNVEVWLAKTLQKLDSLLLGVCQDFKEENYLTVVDAYALIGDITGLAEKIQSFFMQEVLSETQSVLKNIIQEDQGLLHMQKSRTYSDLCLQIPESKFRECLLRTLGSLYKLMCSYYSIMGFQPDRMDSECRASDTTQNCSAIAGSPKGVPHIDSTSKALSNSGSENGYLLQSAERMPIPISATESATSKSSLSESTGGNASTSSNAQNPDSETRDGGSGASSSGSSWDHLRKDAIVFVSQTLHRGRKNLWQLTTSRISVLLSSSAVCSSSVHQFLRNYEDLNVFILAGEAFCGVEAVEFRQRLKTVCENHFAAFHRQNIYALKMVLEKETWLKMPPDTVQIISFAGLVGDGAPIIAPSDGKSSKIRVLHSRKLPDPVQNVNQKNGFAQWVKSGNPFLLKLTPGSKESPVSSPLSESGENDSLHFQNYKLSPRKSDANDKNKNSSVSEDENEDLHADFIDEDSQLPSRISKPSHSRNHSSHCNDEDITAQTGSSLSLLRLMDKYARLMQKLEIVNIEFFRGICQLFEVFFHYVFEAFCQRDTYPSGKGSTDPLNPRLKTALSRIAQDCDQWLKPQAASFSSFSPTSDVTPTSPPSHTPAVTIGLKERCAGVETVQLVARVLQRSKAHLQSMLLQNNAAAVEDFYVNLVGCVPDLTNHIHRTTARLLLHINGYVDRIANSKWEVKELGLEHNGYVDLLLGEFKHYKTRLAHGGIDKEVQDLLLAFGLENVAETLIEGLSRVKRCTPEGRALMSLDLQVLINGLKHFVSFDVRPKVQIVETFIKAYYLPETEYVHWARAHPEYSKNQITGLVNLVASTNNWKRKTRLEVLEKIEAGSM
ncbi:syndetin-like isoform X1 [Papaver somniferum]|uniref:syndetin-like isoform X1 n=2 Tax=Papaver somniferum TaxID=3469 RepID=UPI000E700C20|nr:syndetin-like isoform X1 [Papaver somniferum]